MFTNIILDQMYLKSAEAAQRLKPAARQAFTGPVQLLSSRLERIVGLRTTSQTFLRKILLNHTLRLYKMPSPMNLKVELPIFEQTLREKHNL